MEKINDVEEVVEEVKVEEINDDPVKDEDVSINDYLMINKNVAHNFLTVFDSLYSVKQNGYFTDEEYVSKIERLCMDMGNILLTELNSSATLTED